MLLLFIWVYGIYRASDAVRRLVEYETYFCNIKKILSLHMKIFTLNFELKAFTSLHYICNVLERFSFFFFFAKCRYASMLKHYSKCHSDLFQNNPHFRDAEKMPTSVAIPFSARTQVMVIRVDWLQPVAGHPHSCLLAPPHLTRLHPNPGPVQQFKGS